jgi:hypothetical protein
MTLINPTEGPPIDGIDMPKDLYWVVASPAPLAGMRLPTASFPWSSLLNAGFHQVVSLHPTPISPAPLTLAFADRLEDLIGGGLPSDEGAERARIHRAVNATLKSLRSGQGVVIHCWGGRGRTGTVIGCVLRELGYPAGEAIAFLDNVHRVRGKPGWPESPWQSRLVEGWKSDG